MRDYQVPIPILNDAVTKSIEHLQQKYGTTPSSWEFATPRSSRFDALYNIPTRHITFYRANPGTVAHEYHHDNMNAQGLLTSCVGCLEKEAKQFAYTESPELGQYWGEVYESAQMQPPTSTFGTEVLTTVAMGVAFTTGAAIATIVIGTLLKRKM